MEESAKIRRGELIEQIKRQRQMLSELELIERTAPSPMREEIVTRKRQITEILRSLENGLHELNVQLIREGLAVDPSLRR